MRKRGENRLLKLDKRNLLCYNREAQTSGYVSENAQPMRKPSDDGRCKSSERRTD